MKKQIIMGLAGVVAVMILVAGCNKGPETGYTSDGRPAKPLKLRDETKGPQKPVQERNMMDYLYKGKK